MRVVHPDPTLGQFNFDPPILAGLTRRATARATHLHLTVRVRHRSRLFGKRATLAGSRLHSSRSRSGKYPARPDAPAWPAHPGVFHIRVRHRWVLAQNIHAIDIALVDRIHDLGHGQALSFESDLLTRPLPDLGEGASEHRHPHALIVWQEHRDQAGIRAPLYVVLTAQRVQARPGDRLDRSSDASEIRQRELSVP